MPDEAQNEPSTTPEPQHGDQEAESHQASPIPDSAGGQAPMGAPAVVYCTQCGSRMRPEDRFCHACGWDVETDTSPLQPSRVANPSDRNRLAALLLAILLGWMGAHRFYVGKIGTGLVFLFTMGFLYIGVIYDLVLIATGEFRDDQERRVVRWD
jgi:TM2 domain